MPKPIDQICTPAEPRLDFVGYAVIGLTICSVTAIWAWERHATTLAASAIAAAIIIIFWRDLRLFRFTPLSSYLLFTTVFYAHRYLGKWGDPENQTFREQAPEWIRASKDVIWLLLCFYVVWLLLTRSLTLRYRHLLLVSLGLGAFSGSAITSFWLNGSLNQEDILLYLRRPLEYIPALFLVGLFARKRAELVDLGRSAYALSYLVLGFLVYEAATGADNGFNWGGFITRYGSIFGSPNDLGLYSVFVLTFFLCLWDHITISRWRKWCYAFSFAVALVLTVSFGALAGIALSFTVVIATKRSGARRIVFLCGGILLLASVFETDTIKYLIYRSDSMWQGTEGSVLERAYLTRTFSVELRNMDLGGYLLGMRNPVPIENYYLRTFSRQGIAGIAALTFVGVVLVAIQVRVWRAEADTFWKAVYLGCLTSTLAFFLEMAAHPRMDIFPTNFYFWLLAGIPLVPREEVSYSQLLPGRVAD